MYRSKPDASIRTDAARMIGTANETGATPVRTIRVLANLEFSSTSPNESMLYGQIVML